MKPRSELEKATLALKQVLEESRKRKTTTAPKESVDDFYKRHGVVHLKSAGVKGIKVVFGGNKNPAG